MKRRLVMCNLILIFALGLSGMAVAGSHALSSAQKIQAQNQDAVVWVEGVLKVQMSMQGETQSRDQEVQALATVVCPTGLAVVSKSSLNPTSMVSQMMQRAGMGMSGVLADVKMVMPDGTEVPAEVVIEDDILDISIIAPIKSDDDEEIAEFKYVDLENSGSAAVLDEVVNLSRMPKFMNRQEAVTLHRVSSLIERPRKFYALDSVGNVGTPVFSSDGKLVGLSALRMPSSSGSRVPQDDGVAPVVLPSDDIIELVDQARRVIEEK